MHFKTSRKKREGETRRVGWLAGAVGALLLISAGLELLAHRIFGPIDMDTLVWSLYLGFWTYVLGSTCFLILLGRWFVDWRRVRASRTAMGQLSSTETKRPRFEGPELGSPPHILEQGVAPVVPRRSSWTCDGGNEANSRTRVA
ncbi:MAG: hypothetical protein L0H94_08585 [Nitrospira sp.]|nr:hypothetical protein [Nitrospira sp.]